MERYSINWATEQSNKTERHLELIKCKEFKRIQDQKEKGRVFEKEIRSGIVTYVLK